MCCGRFILLITTLAMGLECGAAAPANAGEPKVVENPDRGLWDDTPGKTFHLLENLLLGSEEGDDAFGQIAGVVVDSRDRIIILDRGFTLVRIYDPESMEIIAFGRKGEGPGEFNFPTALGVDAEDRIYVASQNGRVAIFSPEGELVDEFRHEFPGGGLARSIKVGAGGIYLAWLDPVDHRIVHRHDRRGKYLSSFSDSHAVEKPMDRSDEMAFCGGAIDLDADGFVYFTQSTPYQIRKFTADGRLILTIQRRNDFMQPPRVERNADGARYHAYAASSTVMVLPDGSIMNTVNIPPAKDGAPPSVIVDLFNADGQFLKSRHIHGHISIRCRDAHNQLYAVEERGYPVVVRYDLKLP